jgi:hypothetical protein
MTVAGAQHRVDALPAFLDAQATLSDRVRDEARGLFALEVRREYRLHGTRASRDGSRGSSRGLGPARHGVRAPPPPRGHQKQDQEGKN